MNRPALDIVHKNMYLRVRKRHINRTPTTNGMHVIYQF